jgi:hypothetical protein
MDNTKFIQNSAKASFNQTSKRMCFNFTAAVSITAIILMAITLISSYIVAGVDAKPRPIESPQDICPIAENEQHCFCSNDTENLTATCCTTSIGAGTNCETCDIDTKTGDFVNCVATKGFTNGGSNLPGAPHHGAYLGSQPQNPGNVMIFNPPNNAKTFVNSNNSSK